MRKALVVGIDYYQSIPMLHGCVNDAHSVKSVLDRHVDGSVNFGTKLMTGVGEDDIVTREEFRATIEDLFSGECEIALLYFAGHGHIETTGGYLCAGDTKSGNDGIPLLDIMTFANASNARNKIIILDSCHSGIAGNPTGHAAFAELSDGITILTASTADQYAGEENGSGVFTDLFVDALSGAAANLIGDVTPGAVYAHVDQSLGPWGQRPVFKTNVQNFVSLRKVQPSIPLDDIRKITEFFPNAGVEFQLDPAYEPERDTEQLAKYGEPDPDKTPIFSVLQKLNRVNLVVPIDAPHMWHAAMNRKACKLTVLGEHYRRLVERNLL